MSKTILITGASSGFGLLLATQLHHDGYNVIGTSRNIEKLKVPFKLLALDISDDKSIQSFTKQLFETTNNLDILINNAGYMHVGIAEETSIEDGKKQFDTNFWGTINLTNAILPFFRKQKSGQIITVSSMMGLIGLPGKSIYTASKHALEGYFKSLRFELDQFNIKVNMLEPMWFKTNLGNHSSSSNEGIKDYDVYRKATSDYIQKSIEEAEQPYVVLHKIRQIMNAKAPQFRNPVGKMSKMILFLNNHAYGMFESAINKSINILKKQ